MADGMTPSKSTPAPRESVGLACSQPKPCGDAYPQGFGPSGVVTHARLLELLRYDPVTGIFSWRVWRSGRVHAGSIAGTTNKDGYTQISIDNRVYVAHRLAWLYMTGEWPTDDVDHKHGIRNDNRWSELREATKSQNGQNRRKANANNQCGLLGVSPRRDRWAAQIKADGRNRTIGHFDTPQEAHAAYLEAKARLHPYQQLVPPGAQADSRDVRAAMEAIA